MRNGLRYCIGICEEPADRPWYVSEAASRGNAMLTRDPFGAMRFDGPEDARQWAARLPEDTRDKLYDRGAIVLPVTAEAGETVGPLMTTEEA